MVNVAIYIAYIHGSYGIDIVFGHRGESVEIVFGQWDWFVIFSWILMGLNGMI